MLLAREGGTPDLLLGRSWGAARVLCKGENVTKQAESKLSRKIMQALEREGVFCFKVHGSAHMMSGLPDIIACVDGTFVGFETKMPGKRGNVSEVQRLVHTKIAEARGHVEVVTSAVEALEFVEAWRHNRRMMGR